MKTYLQRLGNAMAILAAMTPAFAIAAFPDKPIRMVVPYSAGGGADNTARIVAQKMGELLNTTIVIDNRPGAGGVIGADNVAKATADGYTVLYDASAFAVNAALRKLPFDPARDFIPVSLVATAPQILVVATNAPYKTVADLVAAAKKAPGKLTFASAGAGTGSHLAAEMFDDQAKIELLHVPYKGGAPALTDVMGGQVATYFGNSASTLQYVTGGKLRALAVTSKHRVAALPNTPTMAESGMPNYEVLEWNAVFLPKGTPPDRVQAIANAVQQAVADPAVKAKLQQAGLDPVGNSPQAFKTFLQTESARWHELVKARNIRVE
ncbi:MULTISPECIES: tripartite tricarboxylate transporter substrate binding protein [Cupriavidus]|uniref:Tripartite tricarboxylate transporter substrate binding protein n=2 Tax=Cupriavidus TaxID=106589 RepID=A0A5P2H947_9BURK|nr:tripartite tricarboxylate transporter substrate binding protein [Cupriavidus pauculus]QET04717.1 tripartite tricarboxylate transporter substrate binding protein [Cupriavidus pauculus]